MPRPKSHRPWKREKKHFSYCVSNELVSVCIGPVCECVCEWDCASVCTKTCQSTWEQLTRSWRGFAGGALWRASQPKDPEEQSTRSSCCPCHPLSVLRSTRLCPAHQTSFYWLIVCCCLRPASPSPRLGHISAPSAASVGSNWPIFRCIAPFICRRGPLTETFTV